MTLFHDRADAARQLVAALPPDIDSGWLVLALPRGGVPLGAAIARHIGAPLDILTVRKVGTPGNPELALAAVTGGREQDIHLNRTVMAMTGLSEDRARALAREVGATVDARRRAWTGTRPPPSLAGKRVLVVDDGAATGTTLAAAVGAARQAGARDVVVALPVALRGALSGLGKDVRVVCPHRDMDLPAVGSAYAVFGQVDDAEVARLLTAGGADAR